MKGGWPWVLLGGLMETCWATGMKMSDAFTDIPWTIFTFFFLAMSVVFLNKGLKSGIPTGICYAVWVGIGAVGSIVVGIIAFGEVLNILGWMFLAIIIVGIVGLNYVSESEPDH